MDKELTTRIEQLERISAELEPSKSERDHLTGSTLDLASDFLEGIEDLKGYYPGVPKCDYGIDGRSHEMSSVLAKVKELFTHGISPASGGHVGYIPGGGIYASALGDYLAEVSNEYSGMYFASPGAVNIENACIDWMKDVFGFPASAVGNLASGGSIANLIALTAARDAKRITGERLGKAVIYLTQQVHHCIYKALRIIGLGDVEVRYVKQDERHRMDVPALKELITEDRGNGKEPFLVIASAGTTDTGAIDPLAEVASVAQESDLWFHVDAAYGGFFILVDSQKEKFKGIEEADSLVIDPHKSLFLPYGLGAVLVKDKEAVMRSNHYVANYMQDAIDNEFPTNPADVSPELTKHFRGLRLWLPMQIHGVEPFKACLAEKILLTEYFRNGLRDLGFELGPEPDLSVSYFWMPRDKDQNAFNQKLLELMQKDGRVFLSSTTLDGKFVIRMAILAFRTRKRTIDLGLEMIQEALKTLDNTSAAS